MVASIHLVGLWLAGKYRHVPVRSALSAAVTILRGAALGSAGSVIAVLYLTRFEGYSRIAFAVAALFVVALLWSEHFALRALDEFLRRRQRPERLAFVYGAGPRGALAVRELRSNAARGLTPFGLIDDDPARRRDEVEGVRVLGTLEDLDRLLTEASGAVTTLIVAIQSLPEDRFDRCAPPVTATKSRCSACGFRSTTWTPTREAGSRASCGSRGPPHAYAWRTVVRMAC